MLKLILFATLCLTAHSEAETPQLQFNESGSFKILQLTDLHLSADPSKNLLTWNNIRGAVTAEKPDLLMLTGDMVYGTPPKKVFKAMLDSLDAYAVPYALIFGNHDAQFGVSNAEWLALARKRPLCVAWDVSGLTGDGNYYLQIMGSRESNESAESMGRSKSTEASTTPKAILWCFDSGEESPMSKRASPAYDYGYVHSDQIEWYGKESAKITQSNAGKPIPAIAFMHIPLPEYASAVNSEGAVVTGTVGEGVCSSRFNSGLFCKMLESGDVMGVFCGHDHDNDYSVQYYGLMLAYGRYSGDHNEYYNLGLNGCRVIVLKEEQRSFSTWVRLSDGTAINYVQY